MKRWYVINTKPKKENHVEKIFREAGFEIYNPKFRSGEHVRIFFPGYAFLRFEFPDQFRLVRFTRGVKRVVGNESGPIPIPDEAIGEIRKREVDGLIELEKYGKEPAPGDEIEVMEGPLKGLRGIFKHDMAQHERVLILLNFVSYQGRLIIERSKLRRVL
jgi:transcription antitermination factor NusG